MNFRNADEESFRAIRWMKTIQRYDAGLYRHSLAVSVLAERFARYLAFSLEELRSLTIGGLLHDLGKLRIPIEVLNKPAELSVSERVVMMSHPRIGHHLLTQDGEANKTVLAIVLDHHERLDGSGYPRGLRDLDISTPVRVVTLCDVFTAMTEPRPYANQFACQDALERMFAKRSRLDQILMTQFASMLCL